MYNYKLYFIQNFIHYYFYKNNINFRIINFVQGNAWTETEKAMLSVHLAVGVGFYHHLILKLQLEYNLDLVGTIDFAFMQNVTELSSVSFFEIFVSRKLYNIHINMYNYINFDFLS